MSNSSRGLREVTVRALAKVGLVWAVAVLGALFMAMSAQGQEDGGGYALSTASSHAEAASAAVASDGAPRTAGLAMALVVLAGGVTVLAIGASRGERELIERKYAAEPEPEPDLSLALGLGLLA